MKPPVQQEAELELICPAYSIRPTLTQLPPPSPPAPTLAEELVANLRSEINMNPQTDHQKFHMTVAGVAPVGEVTPEALAQFRAAWVPPRPADAVGMPPVRYGLMRNEQTQTLNERGGVDGS